jgi:hypothetical protein
LASRNSKNAAQNQIVSGSLLARMIVPAITEVCRPLSAHSYEKALFFKVKFGPCRNPGTQTLRPTALEKVIRTRTRFPS